jgi:hypothetical protein
MRLDGWGNDEDMEMFVNITHQRLGTTSPGKTQQYYVYSLLPTLNTTVSLFIYKT